MFGSIVVGTDGSEAGNEAVRQAVELARVVGAELLVVSAFVTTSDDVAPLLGEAVAVAQAAGVAVQALPRPGDPADALLDVAEERDADLIVVGNKGTSGARRFLLGSVPNRVSHHAPCSVLIIRSS
jgi:nucleotide-binding universal stress UspA family protein